MSRVGHLFFDVNMGKQHDGLLRLLEEEGGISELGEGDVAVFVNRAWTRVKLLTADDCILYLRKDHGINPDTIRFLPSCIEGKELNYDKALEAAIKNRYKERPMDIKSRYFHGTKTARHVASHP